jgi:hypothetical protein
VREAVLLGLPFTGAVRGTLRQTCMRLDTEAIQDGHVADNHSKGADEEDLAYLQARAASSGVEQRQRHVRIAICSAL